MEYYIIQVLEILYPGRQKDIDTLCSVAFGMGTSVTRRDVIYEYLKRNNLVAEIPPTDQSKPRLKISEKGSRVFEHYQHYVALDRIFEGFYNAKKNGPPDKAFTIEEMCKIQGLQFKLEYTDGIQYEEERGYKFLEYVELTEEGNSYMMKNQAYEFKGLHFFTQMFFQTMKSDDKESGQRKGSGNLSTNSTSHFNMNVGEMNIHNKGNLSFGDGTTNTISNDRYENITDSIITINENDQSNFAEDEHVRISEAIDKFEALILENFELTKQGKGYVADRLEEILELLKVEQKGTWKKKTQKLFYDIAVGLFSNGLYSKGQVLVDSAVNHYPQYWNMLEIAFKGIFK